MPTKSAGAIRWRTAKASLPQPGTNGRLRLPPCWRLGRLPANSRRWRTSWPRWRVNCSRARPHAREATVADGATIGDVAVLRGRLLALRDDALRQLAATDPPDAGLLRLAADATVVLAALGEAGSLPAPRRGGDPLAARRAQRDAALRQLAAAIGGADAPAERLARDLTARLVRYRPASVEVTPERLAMRAVIDTGLPVPGIERLRKILVEQKSCLDDQKVALHLNCKRRQN